MSPTDQTEGVSERVSVLGILPGVVDERATPRTGPDRQSAGIEIKKTDLRNAEIGLTDGSSLIESIAGSVNRNSFSIVLPKVRVQPMVPT